MTPRICNQCQVDIDLRIQYTSLIFEYTFLNFCSNRCAHAWVDKNYPSSKRYMDDTLPKEVIH